MMDQDLLQRALGPNRRVSDRVEGQLLDFLQLFQKWNATINLVAKSTMDDAWLRHIVDSAQVFSRATPEHRLWLDLGSGGGFPGIVVAILAREYLPELRIHMVESDKRKSVFLAQAVRLLNLDAKVSVCRIEELKPQSASVVSARALAPLGRLFEYSTLHLGPGGVCAFLKGENAADEIAAARKEWVFDLDCLPSLTEPKASVLFVRGLTHV